MKKLTWEQKTKTLTSIDKIHKLEKREIFVRITEILSNYNKRTLAIIYYNLLKGELPRLVKNYQQRIKRRKALPRPKRKTKRKFSRKQLAAQRLFAKRAKAGTLKRRRR